ncbi:hypothetical protein [Aeromonas caviae]|uniref:hypothetical protein n=1 Tax=Aeromonas caviae TaxID=648 RepID=UPI0038D129C0
MNKMILTSVTLVAIAGGTLMIRLIAVTRLTLRSWPRYYGCLAGRRVIEIPQSAHSMTIR